MPTERIDIIVTERGTRQVKRNLEDLASASDRAGGELAGLKRALRTISPTSQLKQTLGQISSLRKALSAPQSRSSWLSTPIAEANTALIQIGQNLRTARREMGTNVQWSAVSEFRQAEQELNTVMRKLQAVRTMQTDFVAGNNVRDRATGLAPVIPRVVTMPEISKYASDVERAARGSGALATNIREVGSVAKVTNRPLALLNRYVGVFGASIVAMGLMHLSDSATVVANRINIVSGSVSEATTSMDELYAIARRTRTPIEELAQLFQKGMMAASELGVDQAQVLKFVEAVGMGLAVQGSSAQTARGALIQLSQAIGTDVVRAEEFNSILEGAYPIALAAAKGIDEAGGSVARLRRLVIDGKVTSKQFFEAVMGQYPQIADMFAQTTPTISQAFVVIKNKMTEYISTSEEAKAISGVVADAIIGMADNIGPLADVIFAVGIAWTASFALGKIALVAKMATKVGLLATAASGLKALLGFAGGPIVGGLSLLAGAAFWVYQNADKAADKINRLKGAMDDGVTALQAYNEHVQIAKQQQEELGGVIDLSTEAMLRQSRAQLQDSLAAVQTEIQSLQKDLGGGAFNVNDIQTAIAEIATTGGHRAPGSQRGKPDWVFDSADIKNLFDMLSAVRDGTGTIDAFASAVDRVRGAGPEVTAAVSDLKIALDALPSDLTKAPSDQAQLWLDQAQSQLTNIAEAIGGLDTKIAAAANAQDLPSKVEALQALADGLQSAKLAGDLVRSSSWITDTADLLKALRDARDLEATMMKALGANAESLNELAAGAERFRGPMNEAAASSADTQASLNKISFTPLESGARNFADQLVRAARASVAINGLRAPSAANDNLPTMASFSPGATRDQVGTNGLMTLDNGGSFTVGGNSGVDQNLIAFWASKGEQVTVAPRGSQSTMGQADRVGQSKGYLDVIRAINEELDNRYTSLVQNNEGLMQQKLLMEAVQTARAQDVILSQEDIALIGERAQALSQMASKMNLVGKVGDAVFGNLESALNNFVSTGIVNFNELAVSIIKDLSQVGMKMMIIAPLKKFFGDILGNALGNTAMPAFNEGADFVVGGTGGVDKNVVAFKASRGERVQVTPAGKQSTSGGNTVIFNISTPDVASFRRSESQMATRAQAMLARGHRNA